MSTTNPIRIKGITAVRKRGFWVSTLKGTNLAWADKSPFVAASKAHQHLQSMGGAA